MKSEDVERIVADTQLFTSHQEWVNKAQSWLTSHLRHGQFFKAILFDSEGKVCLNGKDMADAKYPVYWIWPDQNLFLAIKGIITPREEE